MPRLICNLLFCFKKDNSRFFFIIFLLMWKKHLYRHWFYNPP
ncbi:hypothetical protein PISS_a0281 [Pseudoalteromonas issachenkonii]|uniref:Uncharacterized protein n=1 Tax=Pseudoalteromonas issachenkonii TaxID=152297 RepID=A0ABM6MZJ1_9GAMM|nr:hypothetical protein PISS_a0281 [Pseudoalteromonas issachenkonii]